MPVEGYRFVCVLFSRGKVGYRLLVDMHFTYSEHMIVYTDVYAIRVRKVDDVNVRDLRSTQVSAGVVGSLNPAPKNVPFAFRYSEGSGRPLCRFWLLQTQYCLLKH